jgi:hypothetical protein
MRALLVHNPTAGTKGHDTDSTVDARFWRRAMAVGTPQAVARMCD